MSFATIYITACSLMKSQNVCKDLIIRTCYKVCQNAPEEPYDLVEIFNCKRKSKMINIHVKLFDGNLFGVKTRKLSLE